MDKPWGDSSGNAAHPGPGHFHAAHPLGVKVSNHAPPHRQAPATRHLSHHDLEKKHKRGVRVRHRARSADQLRADIRARAERLVGKKVVGDGECYALADQLLKEAGGHSADQYGKITADADYIWGKKRVDLSAVQPGDILQFRDHEITIVTKTITKTTKPDGSSRTESKTETETHQRGHHTAIVLARNPDGTLSVAEQHVKDLATGKLSHHVRQNNLIVTGGTKKLPPEIIMRGKVKTEKEVTITTTVNGTINAYEAQVKDDPSDP